MGGGVVGATLGSKRGAAWMLLFLVGTVIIYVCGVAWLTVVLGSLAQAVTAGWLPFLIGDAIKLITASLALPAAWKRVK
ncbi:MAG TPA: biotin transporter BioY [Anaerolineales bacterium]|nr:biotin transporter BioY [Anaerolineales bacterium]